MLTAARYFKLGVLVYKCRQRTPRSYLFEELCQLTDFEARRRLRSASSSSLVVRRIRGCLPSAIVLFRSLPHAFGAVCRRTSRLHPRCLFFAVVWRRTSSDAAFRDSIFCFFCRLPVKWLVIIGHVNRSFYLLTSMVTTNIRLRLKRATTYITTGLLHCALQQ